MSVLPECGTPRDGQGFIRLITTAEAAEYLRLKERRIYEFVADGAIPCTKITGKWLFPKGELIAAAIHLHALEDGERDASIEAMQVRGNLHDAVLLAFARRKMGLLVPPGNPLGLGDLRAVIAIRAVANAAGLDFVPIVWERFDLVVRQRYYFLKPLQTFFAFLKSPAMAARAVESGGYDVSAAGEVRFVP